MPEEQRSNYPKIFLRLVALRHVKINSIINYIHSYHLAWRNSDIDFL